jgi:Flp pilus assembly protein TadD
MLIAGLASLHLGRNEAAVLWLNRSIDAEPNSPRAHSLLAAALGNLGRLDDARGAVEAV